MPDSVLFVAGSRGSGKSSFLKQYARGFGRVIVWDPMREYAEALDGATCVDSPAELVAALDFPVVVYRPRAVTPLAFDHWCHCAYVRGAGLALADELATVTTPNKAPGWWGNLLRESRHRGIPIAAAAQRPQEIDKTIIGNATRLVCFRLKRRGDRQYMADEMNIDRATWLDPLQPLQFVDVVDVPPSPAVRGRIVFS